ncbi:hypothetical protein ACQZV8_18195 [Magnetococcales bacterium HHB-1]
MYPDQGLQTVVEKPGWLFSLHPGAKLLCVILLLPVIMQAQGVRFGIAVMVVFVGLIVSDYTWKRWGRDLLRLRWFFLFIFLLYGVTFPKDGEQILVIEGGVLGIILVLRLLLMLTLTRMVFLSTPPMALLSFLSAGGQYLFFSSRLRSWWHKSITLLWFVLLSLPRLMAIVYQIKVALLRSPASGWSRWFMAGESLFSRISQAMVAQEMALLLRGVAMGLPSLAVFAFSLSWRVRDLLTILLCVSLYFI